MTETPTQPQTPAAVEEQLRRARLTELAAAEHTHIMLTDVAFGQVLIIRRAMTTIGSVCPALSNDRRHLAVVQAMVDHLLSDMTQWAKRVGDASAQAAVLTDQVSSTVAAIERAQRSKAARGVK